MTTTQEIRTIRTSALERGDQFDVDTVAVCDLALNGEIDADDYSALSPRMDRQIRHMSQEDACAWLERMYPEV